MSIFAARRDNVRRLFAEKQLPALLVTDERNVTYLTGFTGDSSYLLVAPARELLITDRRYETQLAEECPGLELAIRGPGTRLPDFTAETIGKLQLPGLGIESDTLTVAAYDKFRDAMKTTKLASTSGLVEKLREIKDAGEIEEIRHAVRIA